MKKFLIFILFSSIFLSSCSIDWNDEKNKKITELEKQIQNDLFRKKQECNKEYINAVKQEETEDNDHSIDTIFYSPINNSCLYGVTRNVMFQKGKPEEDRWTWFIINDVYTHELIYSSQMIAINKEGLSAYEAKELNYRHKIKELKGE